MNRLLKTGSAAGVVGAPGFVGVYRALSGPAPTLEHVLGAAGFALAGGVRGLVFAALVRRPSVLQGTADGLAPSLPE